MLNISEQRVADDILARYELKTLHELPDLKAGRRLGRWMLVLLAIGIVTLFLPWQQNITGEGTVSALRPQDRPQTIQNVIGGRIERFNIQEGQFVKRGDTLLIISEIKDDYFDPNLQTRLREQQLAKEGTAGATEQKIQALQGQIRALEAGRVAKLAGARNKIRQSRFKVASDSADLIAIRRNFQISQERLKRSEQMNKDGLISLTDLETRRLKVQEETAKVVAEEAKLNVSRQELQNSIIDLTNIDADYNEKIAKARSDLSSAVSYLAEAGGEISKIVNKISSVAVRQQQYVVRAPQDGQIVRYLKAGVGENIKEGEAIATLQPADPQVAVELYVAPNDVPLIQLGRHVRLEFDGWPAVQFSGWPAVAVGTFGGSVAVIDAVDSKDGKYRLLVKPAVSEHDPAWPKQLRLGSGVYGWVMLNDVPIWYEIWRQLNAFPPNLQAEPKDDAATAKGGAKK